jgi:hypothetical protein
MRAPRATERELARGERVVLGFDGSYARDATALIGCTLDGHLFVLEIWERPESAGKDWRVPRREVEAVMAGPSRTSTCSSSPPIPTAGIVSLRTGPRPTARST